MGQETEHTKQNAVVCFNYFAGEERTAEFQKYFEHVYSTMIDASWVLSSQFSIELITF
jgi:hypothetical protein